MELMFEDFSWILSGAFPWFWAKVNKSVETELAVLDQKMPRARMPTSMTPWAGLVI
jgi:hypothetical protein